MSRLIPGRDPVLVEPAQVNGGAVGLALAPAPRASSGGRQPECLGFDVPVGSQLVGAQAARAGDPGVPAVPHAAAPTPAEFPAETSEPAATAVDELWQSYLRDRTRVHRDRLLMHYTPLVRAVANRMAGGLPSYVDLNDLVQSGVFGLIDAVERFDPRRCSRFESYAAQRIRGAMLDELRAQDWVPRAVRGRTRELERAQERLEGRLRRAATDRELADELGIPVRELRAMVQQVQMVSVEALDEGTGSVAELLADAAVPDPVTVVQRREMSRQLSAAVGQLGERDRLVIRLYYLENRTLAEIGRLIGVTESRVCQLHSRLMVRLRGRLEELAAG